MTCRVTYNLSSVGSVEENVTMKSVSIAKGKMTGTRGTAVRKVNGVAETCKNECIIIANYCNIIM